MHKYLFLISSALAVSAPAWADEAGDTGIVVTANRVPTPIAQVGQAVSVVTRDDIERTQATTATDVLSRLPGVSVSSSGGFGQPASVFIRGAEGAQTLVLIDGVRINDPGDVGGGFDFGTLTIGQFDRVEVVRGSSSVLWGSRAIGGVVNFITAEPTDQWHARAQTEFGWRDRKQAGASATGKLGPLGLSVGGNWMRGDGYSAFDEKLGGTEKDGFESKSLNARASVDLIGGLSADGGAFWTKATYGYDNSGADALNNGLKRDLTGYGNVRYSGLDGRLSARVGYNVTDSHRISDDAVWGPYETNGHVERFEGQASFALIELASVLIGAETEKQTFDDNFGSDASTSLDSYYGNLTLHPLSSLTVNGGLRYDDHADFGHKTTFAANGAWVIGGNVDSPVLRASYSEGFKAPSLYQLYTNAGFRALRPETSKGWDVGVEQPFARGAGRFTVTYFDRKTSNLIDYDFANWNYYNVGRVRSQGLELSMQVSDVQGFDVNLSYTYLDANDRDTGLALPRRPKSNFSASIDKRWHINEFGGFSLGAQLDAGGARWSQDGETGYVGAHTVLNLRTSLALTPYVEVFGRVDNVADAHYEVVQNYGTPGRSAYAGVRVKM